ncbi:MAG: 50S ribosomal protein L21 [Nitrospirales bacterium]|nr:MAG: 50S ribosomal protein L21 [Nitrospirales bacterium]
MYAIIETGGKQYRAEPGVVLQVESLTGDVGTVIELPDVRSIHNDSGAIFGHPKIEHAAVKAEILRHGRTRTIRVFKKKRRKNYRRTKGHRQGFTQIRIAEIVNPS